MLYTVSFILLFKFQTSAFFCPNLHTTLVMAFLYFLTVLITADKQQTMEGYGPADSTVPKLNKNISC
jgi:hypothetical protein